MVEEIDTLDKIIKDAIVQFRSIREESWSKKPHPEKWSRKEILGHLIDSAHNNLRRLIVTQYQDFQKIVYDQDFWVRIQNYQQMDTQDIIDLWTLMNRQFIRTVRRTPPERYHLTTDVGNTVAEYLSIRQLIQMYTDHMAHHLKQILN